MAIWSVRVVPGARVQTRRMLSVVGPVTVTIGGSVPLLPGITATGVPLLSISSSFRLLAVGQSTAPMIQPVVAPVRLQ